MKKKTLLLVAFLAATTMSLTACDWLGKKPSSDSDSSIVTTDTSAPVISVDNVPTTCSVGETVTLPAATAMDDIDGDLSSKVKVTVSCSYSM